MSADALPARRPPAGVVALGILHVVFASLYLALVTCGGLLHLTGAARAATPGHAELQARAEQYLRQQYPLLMALDPVLQALYVGLAVVLVVAGTGLLKLRPWARRASLAFAVVFLGALAWTLVTTAFFFAPALNVFLAGEAARDPGFAALAPQTSVWGVVVVHAVLMAYPVAVLVVLLRPAAREAFAPTGGLRAASGGDERH